MKNKWMKILLYLVIISIVTLSAAIAAVAAERRFVSSGETVLDKKTNLTWTKNMEMSNKPMNFKAARLYIQNLNSKHFGGYNDWRLPDKEELIEVAQQLGTELAKNDRLLYQVCTQAGHVNALGFTNVNCSVRKKHWAYGEMPDKSPVGVIMIAKRERMVDRGALLYVWAVRGGGKAGSVTAVAEEERFVSSGETVLDKETKLMWTKNTNLNKKPMNFKAAKLYVQNLNNKRFAGYDDWRLPDREEILEVAREIKKEIMQNFRSLHNSCYVEGQADVLEFSNIKCSSERYWTDNEFPENQAFSAYLSLATGGRADKGDVFYVWPVRGTSRQQEEMARAASLKSNVSGGAAASDRRISRVVESKGSDSSRYYALIIGNNQYKHLPKLTTAVADAEEVERVLNSKFGFKTKLLLNATRRDILSSLNDFRKTLEVHDSLVIYYAGHGYFDKVADRAYWLPVDAQNDDPVDWIIVDDITSVIKRISARHILLVADSCYSGTMARSADADLVTRGDRTEFIRQAQKRLSRKLLASGGNEPVADKGGGKHSVFADAFIRALQEMNDSSFAAGDIYNQVKKIVSGRSEQMPQYLPIRNSGDEGGDFVFRTRK